MNVQLYNEHWQRHINSDFFEFFLHGFGDLWNRDERQKVRWGVPLNEEYPRFPKEQSRTVLPVLPPYVQPQYRLHVKDRANIDLNSLSSCPYPDDAFWNALWEKKQALGIPKFTPDEIYIKSKILGYGGMGVVVLCDVRSRHHGGLVRKDVVKMPIYGDGGRWFDLERQMLRRHENCEHVIQYRHLEGDCLSGVALPHQESPPQYPAIAMEAAPHGDLYNFLINVQSHGESVPKDVVYRWFLCLVRMCIAMFNPVGPGEPQTERMPSEGILGQGNVVHFDLDPKNLLIGDLGSDSEHSVPTLKLADFGLTQDVKITRGTPDAYYESFRRIGKWQYSYPEQFHPQWNSVRVGHGRIHSLPIAGTYTYRTNLFAVGLCIESMMTLCYPVKPPRQQTIPHQNSNGTFDTFGAHLRDELRYREEYGEELLHLVCLCQATNPIDRPDLGSLERVLAEKVADIEANTSPAARASTASWFLKCTRPRQDDSPASPGAHNDDDDDDNGDDDDDDDGDEDYNGNSGHNDYRSGDDDSDDDNNGGDSGHPHHHHHHHSNNKRDHDEYLEDDIAYDSDGSPLPPTPEKRIRRVRRRSRLISSSSRPNLDTDPDPDPYQIPLPLSSLGLFFSSSSSSHGPSPPLPANFLDRLERRSSRRRERRVHRVFRNYFAESSTEPSRSLDSIIFSPHGEEEEEDDDDVVVTPQPPRPRRRHRRRINQILGQLLRRHQRQQSSPYGSTTAKNDRVTRALTRARKLVFGYHHPAAGAGGSSPREESRKLQNNKNNNKRNAPSPRRRGGGKKQWFGFEGRRGNSRSSSSSSSHHSSSSSDHSSHGSFGTRVLNNTVLSPRDIPVEEEEEEGGEERGRQEFLTLNSGQWLMSGGSGIFEQQQHQEELQQQPQQQKQQQQQTSSTQRRSRTQSQIKSGSGRRETISPSQRQRIPSQRPPSSSSSSQQSEFPIRTRIKRRRRKGLDLGSTGRRRETQEEELELSSLMTAAAAATTMGTGLSVGMGGMVVSGGGVGGGGGGGIRKKIQKRVQKRVAWFGERMRRRLL